MINPKFAQQFAKFRRVGFVSKQSKIPAASAGATFGITVRDLGVGQKSCVAVKSNQLIANAKLSHLTLIVSGYTLKANAPYAPYALAASWLPRGRKYCVPLIGAETFRKSSCRSSLRSTKSISDVLTISKSEDV